MQAVWAGAIFFLLGYFPTMLMMGRPAFSILAAAVGSVPYGMRLCSGLRGMFRGLWLGAIAGLATFLALTHLWSMAVPSQTPATATATASATATTSGAPAILPISAPASQSATGPAAQPPAGAAASKPAAKPARRTATSEELGLQLLGACLASQMVVCAAVCASAGWLAKRRKKIIDRQWDSGKDG